MKRLVLALALAAPGCGYRAVASTPVEERLAVVPSSSLVADAAVVAEVEAGVRMALARASALRSGSDFPRVVVEVVREDTVGEGVAARADGPLARGTARGVTARAWIERAPGDRARETGDVRASDAAAVGATPGGELIREDATAAGVARRLGQRLGRMLLGEPAPADEGM